jgi:mannose-6-phosphate isomerase-like protein (cupin superfamily)
MSAFTIVNFGDLADSAAGRMPGIEARFARDHIDSEHLGVTLVRFEPDVPSPMAHSHQVQEEAYVVIRGSGTVTLDDETLPIKQWDVVRVSPPVVRSFAAGSEGLELIAIGSDKPEGGDGIPAPAAGS